MLGWNELRDDVDMLADVKNVCRLESAALEISVPSEKNLAELAWMCLDEDFNIEFHNRQRATIIGRGRKFFVSVRQDV